MKSTKVDSIERPRELRNNIFSLIKKELGKKSTKYILLVSGIVALFLGNYTGNMFSTLGELFHGKMKSATFLWFNFSFKFLIIYIIYFVLLVSISVWLKYLLISSFGSILQGHKGTLRFSTIEEIIETYKEVPYYPKYDDNGQVIKYEGRSGILISRLDNKAYIDTSDQHTLILGRTRSGKDQTKNLPDIDLVSRSEEQPHIVCTSVKNETLEYTKRELENRGYKVEVLNIVDLDQSFGFDPLDLIKDAYMAGKIDEADELCKTFTQPLYYDPDAKEKVWQDAAMALVNGCILALCHEFVHPDLEVKKPEMVNISAISNMLTQLSGNYQLEKESRFKLDEYFNSLDLNNPARQEYAGVGMSTGQMRSSIMASASIKLQKFASPKVKRMMNRTTFSFEKLTQSDQPYCVMIVLPDYEKINYIIATTWIEQCYRFISQHATKDGDRLRKRIRFLLNEFGNLPPFTNLESMMSVGAGRGMLFDIYLQDGKQLTLRYNKDLGDFIRNQAMTTIFIASSDYDTRKAFSDSIGNKEVVVRSRSGKAGSIEKTINENPESRPLIMPDELSLLLEGEWVIYRSKRKGEVNNDVYPYPIFNKGKTRMLMAHEYLLDSVFVKKPISELNINVHNNKDWSKEKTDAFIKVIDDRIKNHASNEVKKAIAAEERLADEEEKFKMLEQMEPVGERYPDALGEVDFFDIQDQIQPISDLSEHVDSSVIQSEEYQLILKEVLSSENTDWMDEFGDVNNRSDLNKFYKKYRLELEHLFSKERSDG